MATTTRKQTNARTSAVDAVTAPAVKPDAKPDAPAVKPDAKPESDASKASRTAPLDLTALTVEDAPAPKTAAGAGRKAQDNSVAEGWLRDSWSARAEGEKIGKGKAVTVPTAAVGTLKSRLNIAARTLDLGVAIDVADAGNANSKVTFAAKVRKQKRAKPAAAAPATDAPATDAPATDAPATDAPATAAAPAA